jgi:hypothetical protein
MYGSIYTARDRLTAGRQQGLVSQESYASQMFQLDSEERAIERQESQMRAGQMNAAFNDLQNIQPPAGYRY